MSKHRGITVQKSHRRETPANIVRPLGSVFMDGRPFNLLEERGEAGATAYLIEEAGASPDFHRRRAESASRHHAEITPESRWYVDIAALAEHRGWIDAIRREALADLPRAFAYDYEHLEGTREYVGYLAQELPAEWREPASSQLLALLAEVAAPAALDAVFAARRADLFRQLVTGIAANILADIETDNVIFPPPVPETLVGKWERTYREGVDERARPAIATAAVFLSVAAGRHALEPALIQTTWATIVERLEAEGALPKRRRRRASKPAPVQPIAPPPPMMPGFHADWGTVPNSQAARDSILALQGGADGKWREHPENGFPWFPRPGLSFLVSPDDYQTADAAWEAVRSLDDVTADTFMIACAQYIANHAHTRDGLVRITPDDVLAQRGIAKHNRAYKPEDREQAARDFRQLGTITVEGHRDGWEATGRKGKSKRIRVTLEGKLIEISATARKESLSDDFVPILGTREPAGFWYRLGPWAQGFLGVDGSPQLAEMNRTILRYHAQKQRYQKRIGRYLVWIFRNERGGQTFQLRRLLEQSGIDLAPGDHKNPGRFRAAIERALEQLRQDSVIGSYEWVSTPALPGRNWLDEWLCYSVRIEPPGELLERYRSIGKTRLHALPGGRDSV